MNNVEKQPGSMVKSTLISVGDIPKNELSYISAHWYRAQAGDDSPEEHDEGELAVQSAKPKLKPPAMYRVVLLNDDYTPMDFVVHILELFFDMNREKATQVMLNVHTQGKGVCGVYTKDIAETKAAQVNQYARDNEHPLLCEIECTD